MEDVWNLVNDVCSNSAVFCGILHVQILCILVASQQKVEQLYHTT